MDQIKGPAGRPACAVRLAAARERLVAEFAVGTGQESFCAALSALYDTYFRERLQTWANETKADSVPFALVAVGGYGRGGLSPYSDIDVLILVEPAGHEAAEQAARHVFFPLWDLGCDLGHGVRDVADCLEYAAKDFKVFASLLDARFVAGRESLFSGLEVMLGSDEFIETGQAFGPWLGEANAARMIHHGDASALLEPDIKEGLGGLRDTHQAHWLRRLLELAGRPDPCAQTVLAPEWRAMGEHAAFLTLARNHMHLLAGRKQDRLVFGLQRQLADKLGYQDGATLLAVERFLAELHRRMAEIKLLSNLFVSRFLGRPADAKEAPLLSPGFFLGPGGLNFDPDNPKAAQPLGVFSLFAESARTGLTLSWSARRKAAGIARENAAFLSCSPEAFAAFMDILAKDAGGAVLEAMCDTGVTGALFPEYDGVADVVQFDAYHIHPVGRHSLETVRELGILLKDRGNDASGRVTSPKHPERLLLAGLLHDIGKGRGGDHSELGAGLAKTMLERLGAPKDLTADVVHLIQHHLLLPDTATRRDIGNEAEVIRCAAKIGSRERLDMLELLTHADALATGPSAWNSWKQALVRELAGKVAGLMRGGTLTGTFAAPAMLRKRDAVRSLAAGEFDPKTVEARLDQMSPRYLQSVEAADILRHLRQADRLAPPGADAAQAKPVFDHYHNGQNGLFHLTVMSPKDAALFATVTGSLALNDVNILSANLYRWGGGVMVLTLSLSDPPDPLFVDELAERVAKTVLDALGGKLALDYRLDRKRRSPLAQSAFAGLERGPRVKVDNHISDFYTLVEVKADDRIGVLHDIARVLFNLRLDVHIAKVTTLGARIHDVFYVRDLLGQKINDTSQADEIREALLFRLGG